MGMKKVFFSLLLLVAICLFIYAFSSNYEQNASSLQTVHIHKVADSVLSLSTSLYMYITLNMMHVFQSQLLMLSNMMSELEYFSSGLCFNFSSYFVLPNMFQHIFSPAEISLSRLNESEIKILIAKAVSLELEKYYGGLPHEEKASKIWRKLSDLNFKTELILSPLKSSTKNLTELSNKQEALLFRQNAHIGMLKKRLEHLEKNISTLNSLVSNMTIKYCDETKLTSAVEMNMMSVLKEIVEHGNGSDVHPFKEWLFNNFVFVETFASELEKVIQQAKENNEMMKTVVLGMMHEYMESVQDNITQLVNKSSWNEQVEKLIKNSILLYDADKTGQADYALESAGAKVVTSRCSKTYVNSQLHVFGYSITVPIWTHSTSPSNAIQPGIHPGQCWAMNGMQGYLVIELAAVIQPTGFIIEHIPKSISPTGHVNSAPKDFSVYGLVSEDDYEGKLLGKYVYDTNKEPLQYFPVKVKNMTRYKFVELKIHSNYGENYICLYRFRVHGLQY